MPTQSTHYAQEVTFYHPFKDLGPFTEMFGMAYQVFNSVLYTLN